MDLIQSITSIGKYSGDYFWYRRTTISETGLITAAEANWHLATWRIADEISLDTPSEPVFSASGKHLVSEEGQTTSFFELTSAQTDANLMQFIKNEARFQSFEAFIDVGRGNQKKYLEIYVANGKFARRFSIVSGTRKPVITFDIFSNLQARTPNGDFGGGSALPSGAHGIAANFTVGVDELFTPYETA